jgi:hypothetical protein
MSTGTLGDTVPTKRICGARNRRGEPCQCKKLHRGKKCRFHGGMSTGPRTEQGRLRALANLRYWTPAKAAAKANRQQLERQIAMVRLPADAKRSP